jgi:hypothetical protein
MENLDGIMIATTNLTQNLDKTFERRFLYKITRGRKTQCGSQENDMAGYAFRTIGTGSG